MLDVREMPVLYINLRTQIERSRFMEAMLKNNEFKHYKRFDAIRTPENGYDGSCMSHLKAAWELFISTASEYVIVMEDDIVITDLNAINEAVNKTITEKGPFDEFLITHPDGKNTIARPPLNATDLLHFVIYRRVRIPYIIQRGIFTYLREGVLDRCYQSDTDFVAFHSNSCTQLYNYYLSHDKSAVMHIMIADRDTFNEKTWRQLILEFASKHPGLYGRYAGFRFYYVEDRRIYELSPFNRDMETAIEYSDDHDALLSNILDYLTLQGCHRFILWNDHFEKGNEVVVKK